MQSLADISGSSRYSLADWLSVHGLDLETCRRVLGDLARHAADQPAAAGGPVCDYAAPDPELVWAEVLTALSGLLPGRQEAILDTFTHTAKVTADQPGRSRKAFTLDNGVGSYPTIVFSYFGEPSDRLVMAHEFGHALQIRASGSRFVPPMMREVCAFVAEGALLSHTRRRQSALYLPLVHAWRRDDDRYFGVQAKRLRAALAAPETAYRYSWNYPIARHLAIEVHRRCTPDWIWSMFEGRVSAQDVLRELAE